MGWWREQGLPRCVDRALATRPVMRLRGQVCFGLEGRVLEIGFGSGLNIDFYPGDVTSVDVVEPADGAWALSSARRATSPVMITRVGLDGARLPAPGGSYDAVLSTFTLCTIPDVDAALDEVRRVLRPGGRVHVLEHGLAADPRVARWQRRLDPLQQGLCGGCHLTRDVPSLLERAGLRVEHLEQAYLPGPVVARPWRWTTVALAARG